MTLVSKKPLIYREQNSSWCTVGERKITYTWFTLATFVTVTGSLRNSDVLMTNWLINWATTWRPQTSRHSAHQPGLRYSQTGVEYSLRNLRSDLQDLITTSLQGRRISSTAVISPLWRFLNPKERSQARLPEYNQIRWLGTWPHREAEGPSLLT